MENNYEPKIGDIIKHKNHYLKVCEVEKYYNSYTERYEINDCLNCFFCIENFPKKEADKWRACYKTPNIKCFNRKDYKNVYFQELNEIEILILKGSD